MYSLVFRFVNFREEQQLRTQNDEERLLFSRTAATEIYGTATCIEAPNLHGAPVVYQH